VKLGTYSSNARTEDFKQEDNSPAARDAAFDEMIDALNAEWIDDANIDD
jgi:hypothetical protein